MDSVTQAALGAGIVGAMLGRQFGRRALLAGAVLGTLPDMDVVIRYADPLTGMISHRGFSHSVFVLSALAWVLTALAAPRLCKATPNAPQPPGRLRLFMAIWLALITHPLLDAFTAYGTQLFWPFKPVPTSWASIFIIDPFFTLPLLIAVLWGLLRHRRRGWSRKNGGALTATLTVTLTATLAWCVVYLALSLVAKQVVETRARREWQAAGHTVGEVFSVPQPFSILLWRVVGRGANDTYHEAIHGLLDGLLDPAPGRTMGESLQHPLGSDLIRSLAPADHPPLAGLRWFSGDWLRYDDINGTLVVSDLRMGVAAGWYNFRFAVAQRSAAEAGWQVITPVLLRNAYTLFDAQVLGQVMRRVWQPQPPLPLADWARGQSAQ